MAITLNQFGNLGLTNAQKNKLNEAITIGLILHKGQVPDTSALTASQAKQIETFVQDVYGLLSPALTAARYIRKQFMDAAAKAADDALVGGSL